MNDDILQSLCNLMLRNVVFKLFHNLFTHSQMGEPLPILLQEADSN